MNLVAVLILVAVLVAVALLAVAPSAAARRNPLPGRHRSTAPRLTRIPRQQSTRHHSR
ncbi:hypothetical protein [Streptomyces sp. G-G2]|uniref:hypothetical protein n=1 Tax=Streptomyces sp. G-G2 TaxID=3046201 RepID=UPI0024B98851|nr:hypothetical protein [Streptomyces sp. G-G2]MDJ0382371.1 hypothetical protein [Streptomyces sp. G-G2]